MKICLCSILLLAFKILFCIGTKQIFPIGCPLNSISDSLVNVIQKNNCECQQDVAYTEECLDLVDEFHESIRLQDLEAITAMLDKLCVNNINSISNSTGETALLISTRQNGYISYTISLYLIEHGADVNIVGANGISPLINAVQRSNLPLVALLLLNGANIDYSDNRDLSPLFYSVISRNLRMTHFLLKCGSNPNIPDRNGLTPFYFLLKDGMSTNTEEFLELLLDYGASMTDLTLEGKDAISFIIESGNKKLLNKLIEHSSFSKYILRNNIDNEYISIYEKLPLNSTLAEINRKLANAKDKILRIITAIKRGFDKKVIFSLLLPEIKAYNKDICIVRDSEGRNLLWWITHLGDEELIRILVSFYKFQTNTGVLDFELCELHEPDIYGNLPIGHLIYNINYQQELILKESRELNKENSLFYKPTISSKRSFKMFEEFDQINEFKFSKNNNNKLPKFQILEEMLMFQNPKSNTTLWYELAVSSGNDITGEQKIVEYLSSPAIDFHVNSFIVRCFCKPLKRYSIPTPRSIPIIGTSEYDSSISILSLLLLLNKNYTSKVVLQSILREAMLQSFWCIHALQHALITATILGKDEIIRNILLGRVQTLSEVLSSLDYSSEVSIQVASRLLGSLPPEFPNLDDLMAIPVTLLARLIILSNGIEGGIRKINSNSESDSDETGLDNLAKINSIEHNKIFQYINATDENISEKLENTTYNDKVNSTSFIEDSIYSDSEFSRDFFLQYQFDFTESNKELDKQNELDEQNELEEQMNFVRSEMRRGYFEEDDHISQQDTSGEYDSIFSNFDIIFSQKTRLFQNYTDKNDELVNLSKTKTEYRKADSIGEAINLLKQLLSPEMTKFVRSSSFEHIIKILQNSTCNYPRNNEVELFFGKNLDFSKIPGLHTLKDRLEDLNINDAISDTQSKNLNEKIQGILDDFDYFGQEDMETTPKHETGIDLLYKKMDKKMGINTYLGNCLIELPNICDIMQIKEVLWVPMIFGQDHEHEFDPSSTLLLDSQCIGETTECYIPNLNSDYQKTHLGYIPEIPAKANVTDLGPLISRSKLFEMINKHPICDKSSSYTTFEKLLAKKAKFITLLNTSPHNHIIPSAIRISSAIILTSLIYILLWAVVSYLKVFYIKNMINEWSKEKIKRKINSSKKRKSGLFRHNKKGKKRGVSNSTTESKNSNFKSKSSIQLLTKNTLKYMRKALINTLPYSLFRLRDFAEIFPISASGKAIDSVLLALSLIFTSPWYIYKDNSLKENIKDKKSMHTIKTTKSNLLNAPMNYFKQKNSQENTNLQSVLKYLFFLIQVISLIYLFTILFLISEYDYIWFLIGVTITATLCSSVRIYYTHEFVSNYCNKYFCGFSKEYYLYNYYYYKKSVENRKNIRNIYLNLLNCAMNSSTLIKNNYFSHNDNNEYDYDFDCDNTGIDKNSNNKANNEVSIIDNQIEISPNMLIPQKLSSQKLSSKIKSQMDLIPELHAQVHHGFGGSFASELNNSQSRSSFSTSNYYIDSKASNSYANEANGCSLTSQPDSSSNFSSPNTARLNILGVSSSNVTTFGSRSYSHFTSYSLSSSKYFENNIFADDENLSSSESNKDTSSLGSDLELITKSNDDKHVNRIKSNPNHSKVKVMKKTSVKVRKSITGGEYICLPDLLSITSTISNDASSGNKCLRTPWIQNHNFKTESNDINTAFDINSSKSSSFGIGNDKFCSTLSGPAIRITQANTANKRFKSVLSNYSSRIKNKQQICQSETDKSSKTNIYINSKRQKKIPSINDNFNNFIKSNSQVKKSTRLRKIKNIISSVEDNLSCDNIRTNIGNVVTNNQIHKPLYRLVDEVSYNTPYEYFNVVITCKIISCIVAMSSNISITLFKSNSYLIRDSTLYFLYNKSPITVYLIECIFTYWISNLIFEILKGLIILLFFVKQRKRLCIVLVQHIPTQFKYSNVQEFIQIVSYWRSAIQHILYKNTKLWTSFLNASVSINTLIFFCIGKIMLVGIYNKKNRIYNNRVSDLSSSTAMSKNPSSNQNLNGLSASGSRNIVRGSFDKDISRILTTPSNTIGGGISTNLLNELNSRSIGDHFMNNFYKKGSFSTNKNQFMDSISNINYILNSNNKDNYVNKYKDISSMIDLNNHYYTDFPGEGSNNFINNINLMRSIHSGLNNDENPVISHSTFTYSNLASISNVKTSALSFMLTIPQYAASYLSYQGTIPSSSENNMINTYSNCETIFLTMGIVMFIFSSYVIRLLYQINRTSVRTHSWLQNILHRTPPGAGIYIVIEKVLLVINSTPPLLKICGFDITEKLSGFCLYIFTPLAILTFFKFIT
ncbi:Signal peptide,Ankyrin repeat-containing protein [Cryptosporidium meleagridis]